MSKGSLSQYWRRAKLASIVASALFVTACGGSGSDSAPQPKKEENAAPQLTIVGENQVAEKTALTLTAQATDSDGTITSYQWSHDSELPFVLSGQSSANLSVTSPDLSADLVVNFTVEVTDDSGNTAQKNLPVTFKRNTSKLTLAGKVTDQPIPKALVSVQLNSGLFTTEADEKGDYSIELTLDESDAEKLIKLKAKGQGEFEHVEFISQLGSASELQVAAGEDGILQSEENFSVNVTNVTTAEYALLNQIENAFNSSESLEKSKLEINAQAKLELATLIKAIVDNQNVDLPEGINSTLELAKNKQEASAFLTKLKAEQPELVEKTEQALKADENLIKPVSFSLNGQYWLAETAFSNGLYLGLTFKKDGTGYALGEKSYSFTWKQSGQSVDITFVDELILESSSLFGKDAPQVVSSLKIDVFEQNARFKSSTVTITHQRDASSLPELEEGDEGFEDIEEKLKASQVPIQAQLFNPEAMQSLIDFELLGTWSFMHQSEFSDDYIQFEFRNDGTAWDVDEQKSYTYKVDDNIIRISGEEETFEYQLINDFKIWSNLVGYKISDDGKSEFAQVSAVKHQDVSFETVDYKRTWNAEHYRAQSKFAINADGVYQYLWQEGSPSQLQNGVISRSRYEYGGRFVNYCEVSNPECEVDRTYSHKLLAVDGDKIVIEYSNISHNGDYEPYRYVATYTLSDEPLRADGFDESIIKAPVDLFLVQNDSVINLRTANWCNSGSWYKEDCTRKLSFVDENEWKDYSYEFNGDKLKLTDEDTSEISFLEIQFTESGTVSVCRYKDGEVCSSENTQIFGFTEPKRKVIANATEHGQILLASEQVNYQSSIHFSVIAAEGFVIESVTACGEDKYIPEQDLTNYNFSQWLWNDSSVSDCEITATFSPFKPYLGETLLFDDNFYLPKVLELNVSRDGTATGVSGVYLTHAWEEITESHLSFTPPYSFYEQLSQYFDRGFTTQQQEVTSFDIQFGEAEAKVSWQLNSESNDVSLDSVGPVSFKNSKYLEPIAVDELKWVGTWYIIGDNNQKSISLAEDGTGSLRDLNRAYLEPQTLTWSTNEQNQLSFKSDEWGSLDNLELVKGQHGDLILILNESNSFNSDLSLNRGINLFIKHDVDVEQDDLIGRWRFKTGPDQEAYRVLDIRDDLSFEYGGTQGWVTFENSELVLNVFHNNDLGHQDSACSAQRSECVESVFDKFKLMKFDDGVVYFINQYAEFVSAEITQDFSITQFEKFLFNYSEFFLLHDYGYERISLHGNSILWFDYYDVELVDGKLITKPREYNTDESPVVFEILSSDIQRLDVCVYYEGESCENGQVQKWLFELPKIAIDLNFNEGGQIQADKPLENLTYGDNVWINLIPDEGVRVGEFEGCESITYFEDVTSSNITLQIENISASCTLNVRFIEEDGLTASERLGIVDPTIKSCVDNMFGYYPEFSDSLSCYGNDINSLQGIENMSRLTFLALGSSTLSEQAVTDLSSFTQIESLNLSNIITSYLDLSKMSSLNTVNISGAQLDDIDLPQHEGLKHLYLDNTSLSSIDLAGLQGLESLSISGSNITALDVRNNVNLIELNITYSSVESIKGFSSDHQLASLDAHGSNLAVLDISSLEYIRTLNISETKVKVLDISANISLNSLWADNSQLSQLSVSDNEYSELYTLSLENTAMVDIDLSQFPALSHLNIENASVSKLDLTQNIALYNLRASGNDLVELTIGDLPHLTYLDLSDNPLERLNITGQLSSLGRLDLSKTSLKSIDLTYMDESLNRILFEENTLLSVIGLENLTLPVNFSLIGTEVSDAIVQELESYGHYVAR